MLAMSGEETMAQVYREIEHPKLPNLEKAGFVIFVYSSDFYGGRFVFRGHDHSRRRAAAVLRQSDQRFGDEFGRAVSRCGWRSRASSSSSAC